MTEPGTIPMHVVMAHALCTRPAKTVESTAVVTADAKVSASALLEMWSGIMQSRRLDLDAGGVAVAAHRHRHRELRHEDGERAELPREDEVEDRPELLDSVLQRGPRQHQSVV